MERKVQSHEINEKTFRLYVNQSNIKVWEAIRYAESQGISPSDYICKKIIDDFQRDKGLPLQQVSEPVIESKDLVDELVSIAVEYEEKGINGLDISYLLPRKFDQGCITREHMALLGVFLIKSYITFMETGNVRKVLADIDPIDSKRDITSISIMEQFKEHLFKNLQNDPEKIKREEEIRLQRIEEERIQKLRDENLRRIKLEREQWELSHPDIPYWAKDIELEQKELSDKLVDEEYIIVGSPDDDLEYENIEVKPLQTIVETPEETNYISYYKPALEKFLNMLGKHIN